ncbi:uncharacterized protein [Panulirus ornatus]|uniref:uncharacterized protein n=1 Tax=Panulirus ornatus TaxID=150431 RepID=UPI003A8723E3
MSSWVWWTVMLLTLAYLLLGVFSIGVGASFKQACREQEWSPIHLCVFGSIIVIKVILITFWARLKLRIGDSWVQPTLMFAVPFIFFGLVTLIAVIVGGVWLVQERIQSCNGEPVCSSTLQVFSAVIFALINIPFLVLLYVTAVILILAIIFLAATSYHYFYKDVDATEVVTCDDNL